jgi:hypothetical protein
VKQFVLISFLSIFLFNAIGYYFTFGIEDWNLKERMAELLSIKSDQKSLEAITVSLADFNSKIKSQSSFAANEYVWNGNLYDISSVTISGNEVNIKGYHDRDEEKLFSSLSKHFESSSNTSNSSDSKNILKEPVKYVTENLVKPLTCFGYSHSLFYAEYTVRENSGRFVLTPPPNA